MLSLPHYPITPLLATAGIVLDALLGEPRRWHPLVGFGRYAAWVEALLHGDARWRGVLAWLLAVVPGVALAAWMVAVLPQPFGWLFEAVALYFAIGAQSLAQHAEAIAQPLADGDLATARTQVGKIVSRDTAGLDESGVARASVESVLENGSDAVFGALFWFALLGAPGTLLFRLANTLDAMWGYRTPRYLSFGWAAARLDDMLGYIPARLTALTYCLLGNCRRGLACWRAQAPQWYSPNAGPVMSAGAGALQLALGGAAQYHGIMKERPVLGEGVAPTAADIQRAVRLVRRGMGLWAGALLVGGLILA